MNKTLAKFKIGLMVLGVFAVVLLVIVMMQAGATKSDTKTFEAANKIANTLQTYVSNHGSIPSSLQSAGVKETVPPEVVYTKLSDEEFKFCVTYKAASSGFDPSSSLMNYYYSAQYGGSGSGYDYKGDNTYLYLDSTHKKGENCQTIKPYLYSSYDYGTDYGSPSSGTSLNYEELCKDYASYGYKSQDDCVTQEQMYASPDYSEN